MEPGDIEERLSEFVERRDRGESLTPEAFAAEHPGSGAALLAALHRLAAAESLLPSGAPDLPARIGPYRVRGEIGRGGMGRVLDVDDPERAGARLALKLLHASLAHQPRAIERFRREGEALERLRHPGIVRVHAAGLLDDRPFLAMERVEGTSLAEHLRQARERRQNGAIVADALQLPGEGPPRERALRLVVRLARAMAAAHREGVLHRDLNPRNVLVRASGEPVLIDFGLVRAGDAPTLTGSGDLLGTPLYMSPEQARGERVDERSDVFGLGMILRELLTLEPPRSGADTLTLVRAAGSRPLRSVRGLPVDLATILRRATSFFPRWRYPSCEALAEDLERHLGGQPVRAGGSGLVQRTCETLHVRRRTVLVGGTLLVALAIGLAVRAARNPRERHEALVRGTTAVFVRWLEDDPDGARAALDDLLAGDADAPFADFLAALVQDDLARDSADAATRALLEGERARRTGDPALALKRFRTAWDLRPDFPMVLFLQGLAAFEAGDFETASTVLAASFRSFTDVPRLHLLLARSYAGEGRPHDVERALEAYLALRPGDGDAWLFLARARLGLGDDGGALEAALRARGQLESDGPLEALAREWEGAGAEELARTLRGRLAEGSRRR